VFQKVEEAIMSF